MWLLHTTKHTLEYFPAPPAEYAILSHVWEKTELTFQQVKESAIPNAKVNGACRYAAHEGFHWLWVDTCCIDKTNSTELSEAINSMFSWYATATICYAYLADVQTPRRSIEYTSRFRSSRWHTRGWTLQELLAPAEVRFLSSEWEYIGDKTLLAPLLEEITGIEADILVHGGAFSSISIADRMSWASHRVTTRPEDEAYCLMGIFNVNIPIIYGEGRRAFRRLQEEIMRTSPDHTLFMWGLPIAPSSTICLCSDSPSVPRPEDANLLALSPQVFSRPGHGSSHSVATSPEVIPYSSFMSTLESLIRRPMLRGGDNPSPRGYDIPEFTVTSYGIRARLPIIPLPAPLLEQSCSIAGADSAALPSTDDAYLALLACSPRGLPSSNAALTGLILRRPHGSHVLRVGALQLHGSKQYRRYIDVTPAFFELMGAGITLDWDKLWETVYIAQELVPEIPVRPSKPREADSGIRVVIPYHIIGNLRTQCFVPRAGVNETYAIHISRRVRLLQDTSYTFLRITEPSFDAIVDKDDGFRVHLGLCCSALWIDVEVIQRTGTSDGSTTTSLVPHTPGLQVPNVRCPRVHLHEWSTSLPPGEHWKLDRDIQLRWSYYRTFQVNGRNIHLRAASRPGVRYGEPELIHLAIEVDVRSWDMMAALEASMSPTPSASTSESFVGRLTGRLRKSRSQASVRR